MTHTGEVLRDAHHLEMSEEMWEEVLKRYDSKHVPACRIVWEDGLVTEASMGISVYGKTEYVHIYDTKYECRKRAEIACLKQIVSKWGLGKNIRTPDGSMKISKVFRKSGIAPNDLCYL